MFVLSADSPTHHGPGILVSNCSDKGIPNNMQAMKTWRMSCYIATYSEQLASKAGLCMMIIFKERAVRLFHLDRHLHSPIFCLPANLFTFLAHFPRLPSFLTCSLVDRKMIRLGPKNKTPTGKIGFDKICPVSSTHKIYFQHPAWPKRVGRVKIIFVPSLPPQSPAAGNLGQIWEVKVRNCRHPLKLPSRGRSWPLWK